MTPPTVKILQTIPPAPLGRPAWIWATTGGGYVPLAATSFNDGATTWTVDGLKLSNPSVVFTRPDSIYAPPIVLGVGHLVWVEGRDLAVLKDGEVTTVPLDLPPAGYGAWPVNRSYVLLAAPQPGWIDRGLVYIAIMRPTEMIPGQKAVETVMNLVDVATGKLQLKTWLQTHFAVKTEILNA